MTRRRQRIRVSSTSRGRGPQGYEVLVRLTWLATEPILIFGIVGQGNRVSNLARRDGAVRHLGCDVPPGDAGQAQTPQQLVLISRPPVSLLDHFVLAALGPGGSLRLAGLFVRGQAFAEVGCSLFALPRTSGSVRYAADVFDLLWCLASWCRVPVCK